MTSESVWSADQFLAVLIRMQVSAAAAQTLPPTTSA